MSFCKPFGNKDKAQILVIGHDPRLRKSDSQAQYAFFLDYLAGPPPTPPAERRKYGLASSVIRYIQYLTGPSYTLHDMVFTNLCNEFLERPSRSGTVLIPDEVAEAGVRLIEDVLYGASFNVIIPMAPQVLYHFVRVGFVVDPDENLLAFLETARPSPVASERKAYVPVGRSPFLRVCGRRYAHRCDRVPIVPIVHVKQWPLNARLRPHYGSLMRMAAENTRACLSY